MIFHIFYSSFILLFPPKGEQSTHSKYIIFVIHMGHNCSNCIPQINADQESELTGSDFPHPTFAYP